MWTSLESDVFLSLYFCTNKWSRLSAHNFLLAMNAVCQFSVMYHLLGAMHKFHRVTDGYIIIH